MEFWTLINENVSRPLTIDAARGSLGAALTELSSEDVIAFCETYNEKMNSAYRWDLWGVAYLINGGCSDDSFMDFRASLILLGESVYEGALRDPESLMQLEERERSELFEEGALYIGAEACEARGLDVPGRQSASDPAGEPWEESREDLMARFPQAWAVYGWEEASAVDTPPPSVKKPWWKFW